MEAKEKAKELVKQYYNFVGGWTSTNKPNEVPTAQYEGESMKIGRAKQCALIAVDEILKFEQLYLTRLDAKMNRYTEESSVEYWQEVKQEIGRL